jgi:adenosylcobinamide kinase / adenosylcobinamide-phosphate guanylyltransferase
VLPAGQAGRAGKAQGAVPFGREGQDLAVALRPRGRLAVVVGGGATAVQYVGRLLSAGARVLVIAHDPTGELADLGASGLITLRDREFRPADLDGAWLALACADDESANAAVAADAERRHIWCAASADDEEAAAVLLPARQNPAGRRVLVLGGARSGKSAAAESMLADAPTVDYVATGLPEGAGDAEWDQRVREHLSRRPAGWRTLETCEVAEVLADGDSAQPVLIDCLATWLARVMDDCGLWSGDPGADGRLSARTDRLVHVWEQTSRHAIAVSNEVGSGVVPATASGRKFRDELGWLNSRIAAASEEVWLCTAGIPRRLR